MTILYNIDDISSSTSSQIIWDFIWLSDEYIYLFLMD